MNDYGRIGEAYALNRLPLIYHRFFRISDYDREYDLKYDFGLSESSKFLKSNRIRSDPNAVGAVR